MSEIEANGDRLHYEVMGDGPPLVFMHGMCRVVPAVQSHLDAGDLPGAVDAFFEVVGPDLWRLLDETAKEPYRQSGPMLVADLGQPPFIVTPDDLAGVRLPILGIAGLDSD